jgi:hypothetical protein
VLRVHLLGALNLQHDQIASGIAYVATASLGAGLPHLGMQKWVNGHQAYFKQVFQLVETLDPGAKSQVIKALPEVNGDIMQALEKALGDKPAELPLASKTPEPVEQDDSIDTSGDVEEPNSLVDVEAPALDPVPPGDAFGDDAVHAPPDIDLGGDRPPGASTATHTLTPGSEAGEQA